MPRGIRTKTMPHIHEKIDFTAEVFVVFKNKVLLRKHDKYKMWLSIGGHVELDEDPNQAALREVREEVGLDITLLGTTDGFSNQPEGYSELIPPVYMNRHRINDLHEHVTMVFFATSQSDAITPQEEGEVSEECRWFDEVELEDPKYLINDTIKTYAQSALVAVKSLI